MGCCASRPTDDTGRPPPPTGRPTQTHHVPDAPSSRPVQPASAVASSIASTQLGAPRALSHNTASHSSLSTPRHSSAARRVALHEHYNSPLHLPSPWSSTERTWTHLQLERERADFFDTRVTGRQEIWDALKNVCDLIREGEIGTAQGILEAAAVTIPSGNLTDGCYDEAGNLYRIPEVILLDPVNVIQDDVPRSLHGRPESNIDGDTMIGVSESKSAAIDTGDTEDEEIVEEDRETVERRREEKGKGSERDAIKVRCRLSDRGGADVVILIGKSQSVGTLIRRVHADANLTRSSRIRIAYLGKILDEKETLLAQGWKEGHVVNALVT